MTILQVQMSSLKRNKTEKKEKKDYTYVVTSYYFVGGEPDDSGVDVKGIYNTHKEAHESALESAREMINSMNESFNSEEDNENNENDDENVKRKIEFIIDSGINQIVVKEKDAYVSYGGGQGCCVDYVIYEIHRV